MASPLGFKARVGSALFAIFAEANEHDRNLIQFLETTRDKGPRLNKAKIQFKKKEVSFFRHSWNTTGISPDPKKVECIMQMAFPEDKETMHSFLGLINILNRYSPHIAQIPALLRELVHKDGHYMITEEHRSAFSEIKTKFTRKILLPYLPSYFYKMKTQSTMPPEASPRLRRITRMWRENAWQQYGVWKSSIISFMTDISCCRQIKNP